MTDRRPVSAVRPLGVKLELTHACNLRCDFCYTDSPRRTLAPRPELDDGTWARIAQEAIDLGALEASLTGGEALLRPELTLDLIQTFDSAGLGVSLNTNGWFVSEALAAQLAEFRNLTVHVSIDGPAPAIHDPSRGVPSSWRRAVTALDRLLRHGVHATVVHVVTPWNQATLPHTLDLLWTLGIHHVRITPVAEAGAAAGQAGWTVDEDRIAEEVARAVDRHGPRFVLSVARYDELLPGKGEAVPILLVHPSGTVVAEAVKPFRLGDLRRGTLADAWARLLDGWEDPAVRGWEEEVGREGLTGATIVPYRDPDIPLDGLPAEPPRASSDLERKLKRATDSRHAAPAPEDHEEAVAFATALVLARRWRVSAHRWAGALAGPRVIRMTSDGTTLHLGAAASRLFDAFDGASLATALERCDEALTTAGAIDVVHELRAAGLLQPLTHT